MVLLSICVLFHYLNLENNSNQNFSLHSQKSYRTAICLAYQSLGVVYGDLSISPIYVFKSTFSGRLRLHEDNDEILGVLSLVFWTLTLIPLCKYVIFVLGADDNGEGACKDLVKPSVNFSYTEIDLVFLLNSL